MKIINIRRGSLRQIEYSQDNVKGGKSHKVLTSRKITFSRDSQCFRYHWCRLKTYTVFAHWIFCEVGWLPGGQVTARRLWNASSFGCVSVMVGYFSKRFLHYCSCLKPRVLVWLGIFWLCCFEHFREKQICLGQISPAVFHQYARRASTPFVWLLVPNTKTEASRCPEHIDWQSMKRQSATSQQECTTFLIFFESLKCPMTDLKRISLLAGN